MNIEFIVLLAVGGFYLALAFDVALAKLELAQQLTRDLVIGYLGYLTHAVKTLIDERK
ncbi:hypothetical protein AA637_11805 [Cyanobacterium sp. HL-69]|uniref:hypothetical protein n=1 Tax=Cyanobacterium sp. HL-69 TaxID=2054282 RepID=UPI000CA2CFA7|nr:hypothetical protein AA637_11805 [Cyanobacterium sp. HL-69]